LGSTLDLFHHKKRVIIVSTNNLPSKRYSWRKCFEWAPRKERYRNERMSTGQVKGWDKTQC